ncbi:MAG: prenyltransferase/squalene oxidase repeat-containing protein [Kiritimatiellia bacterium]|jgi:hypothetical protein
MTRRSSLGAALALLAGVFSAATPLCAQPSDPLPELDPGVEESIDKALAYLASVQKEDGSFPGNWGNLNGIVGLAGMAFLSRGHLPGEDRYGRNIERCFDYLAAHVNPSNGYFGERDGKMYSHGICTLFLSELSGMIDTNRQATIDTLLPQAVQLILAAQRVPKNPDHQGGWRYTPTSTDSDLSCSGWCLMALRSSRLNGAPVPVEAIDSAVAYILRRHNEQLGTFGYQGNQDHGTTQTGNGLLCLELCGRHGTPPAQRAAAALMRCYTQIPGQEQAVYGLYYASQALFQVGGEEWREFSRWMYDTYIPRQAADGSWNFQGSPAYATAMCTLAFTVPCRQLPIYQRDETVDE